MNCEELVKELRLACEDERYGGKHLYLSLINRSADAIEELQGQIDGWIEQERKVLLKSAPKWMPLKFDGLNCDIPDEYDGCWIIVTDGREISVERFKQDAYDHFCPNGRWFDLEDVTHWMPLPGLPKEETE